MRRTGTNAQVAHVWAQDNDYPEMRSNSMSMSGDSIYSYSARIGRFVTSPRGNRIALLSSNKWSVTTSSHQSEVWHAVHHKKIVYVPDLDNDLRTNVEYYLREITNAFNKSIKSRRFARSEFDRGERLITTLQEYVYEFQYEGDFTLPNELQEKARLHVIKAEERLAFYENETLEEQEKRLGPERAKREAIKKRKEAQRLENIRRHAENMKLVNAEYIEKWRRGESNHYPYIIHAHAELRLKPGDPNTVQTSRGAEFPLEEAKRAFQFLRRPEQSYEYVHGHNKELRLGHFRIDRFVDGIITAGCHTVEWSEAVRFMETIK
jgi:hypothetical protein